MVGENNSIWSRIREAVPYCIQMKCLCHSLTICIQHAFAKLPTNIGFLLSKVPGWFSHINQRRRDALFSLFKVINEVEKLSATHWLVRGKVLYSLFKNWEELKAYITCAEAAQNRPDTKYKARLMKEMLNDSNNYLYFIFATPVVQEFERLRRVLQTATFTF